jgi:hypothetical protein
MRITALLVAFITGLTLAVAGCGGTSELEEAPAVSETVAVEEQQSSEENTVTAQAICPLKWTCFNGRYYSTYEQCTAACGGATCERDYACTGTCVCP